MIMRLFNKDDRGSIELEDLTGQWYASSPYRAISTEIDFAVREVQNRVGMEVMNLAVEAYQKGEDMELANAVRMPVAFLAIMRYASLSTVSHESTGPDEAIPYRPLCGLLKISRRSILSREVTMFIICSRIL